MKRKLKIIPYQSKSGKEFGVVAYALAKDSIILWYNSTKPEIMIRYTYSYKSAGETEIKEMRTRAKKQRGLSTYVSKNKPDYDDKIEVPALKDSDFS
jgi:hypothetical protein